MTWSIAGDERHESPEPQVCPLCCCLAGSAHRCVSRATPSGDLAAAVMEKQGASFFTRYSCSHSVISTLSPPSPTQNPLLCIVLLERESFLGENGFFRTCWTPFQLCVADLLADLLATHGEHGAFTNSNVSY